MAILIEEVFPRSCVVIYKTLKVNLDRGQIEENLQEMNLGHRRLIEGNYKIIYRLEENTVYTVYITDIFDSRRDPSKMKG